MKKVVTLIIAVSFIPIFSQEEPPKDGWKKNGNFSLMFNQSSFSNWVAGGDNALAGNAMVITMQIWSKEPGIGIINFL